MAKVTAGGPSAGGGVASGGEPDKRRKKARVPRWAKVCTIFGALLMVLSGGVLAASEVLVARYEHAVGQADLFGDEAAGAQPPKQSNIKGPLNILLVGIDPRPGQINEPPRSDSIMILHVSKSLDQAYLFSIPRDLVVDIPAFPKAGFNGSHEKINSAMAHGSHVPGQAAPSTPQGFELLSLTLEKYTGIQRFDAGAIINFGGFQKIVDAMGGVTMYIDQNVKSEHRKPDGTLRTLRPGGGHYLGPQAEYKVGTAHLKGWQALDYVRQRYGLPNSDYDRQRHQQQFVKAMVNQAFSADVVANPIKLDKVLRAAGQSLIFSGRGNNNIANWALALHNIRSSSVNMVKLPGGGIGTGSNYKGEALKPIAQQFFAAVRADNPGTFLASHPELVNKDK